MVNGTAATAASFETVIRHRHRLPSDDRWHSGVVCGSSNSESADCWIRGRSASTNNSRWGVGPCQL